MHYRLSKWTEQLPQTPQEPAEHSNSRCSKTLQGTENSSILIWAGFVHEAQNAQLFSVFYWKNSAGEGGQEPCPKAEVSKDNTFHNLISKDSQ